MKKLLIVVLLAPVLACAQSAFDGTWRMDLSKAKLPTKPDKYLLQNAAYKCESCVPPYEVKADGQDHKVGGHPYFDSVSVRVVDNNTVEFTQKKNGKVVSTDKASVSADGTKLTDEFTWRPEASNTQQTGKAISTRVASGPSGSHAISGSWRGEKLADISQDALTWTYKSSPDGLAMKAATGEAYEAKFDGKDYPYKGDPGTTSISLKKIDANTIEETDKRNGQVTAISRLSVSADGKSLKVDVNDKLHGTTSSFVATKQ